MLNSGTDCFMNSLFKAFIHCEKFANLWGKENIPCKGTIDAPECIACQFVMKSRHSLAGFTIDPKEHFALVMKKGSRCMRALTNGRQQDVHEFTVLLLDECKNELISQLFAINLTRRMECPGRHHHNKQTEKSNCLTLYFRDQDLSKTVTVEELLHQNFEENHDEVELACCCDEWVVKTDIENPPQILIIQLARFSELEGNRLNISVENSFCLKVAGFEYSMCCAVMHASTKAQAGHYYTYIEQAGTGWWKMDDGRITRAYLEDFEADQTKSYLLFYERQDGIAGRNLSTEKDSLEQVETISEKEIAESEEPTLSDTDIFATISSIPPDQIFLPSNLPEDGGKSNTIIFTHWLQLQDIATCMRVFDTACNLLRLMVAIEIFDNMYNWDDFKAVWKDIHGYEIRGLYQFMDEWAMHQIIAISENEDAIYEIPDAVCFDTLNQVGDVLCHQLSIRFPEEYDGIDEQEILQPANAESARTTLFNILQDSDLAGLVMSMFIYETLKRTEVGRLLKYINSTLGKPQQTDFIVLRNIRNKLIHVMDEKQFTTAAREEFDKKYRKFIDGYAFDKYFPFNGDRKKEELKNMFTKSYEIVGILKSYLLITEFHQTTAKLFSDLSVAKHELVDILQKCQDMLTQIKPKHSSGNEQGKSLYDSDINVCNREKMHELKILMKKKLVMPQTIDSTEEVCNCYDVSLCIIATDKLLANLLQRKLCAEIVFREDDNDDDLIKILKLKRSRNYTNLLRLLEFINFGKPIETRSSFHSRQEVKHYFNLWKLDRDEQPIYVQKRATIEEMLQTLFFRIQQLHVKNPNYKWPEKSIAALQIKKNDEKVIKRTVLRTMKSKDIVDELRISLVEEMMNIRGYSLSMLEEIARQYFKEENVEEFGLECRAVRNHVVHRVGNHWDYKFANEAERNEFAKNVQNAVDIIVKKEIFPLNTDLLEDKAEQVQIIKSYEFFRNITDHYQKLVNNCKSRILEHCELRKEVKSIYRQLKGCCRELNRLK